MQLDKKGYKPDQLAIQCLPECVRIRSIEVRIRPDWNFYALFLRDKQRLSADDKARDKALLARNALECDPSAHVLESKRRRRQGWRDHNRIASGAKALNPSRA